MATSIDDVVVNLDVDVNTQPTVQPLIALVVRECPDGGTLEVEQPIEGVGIVRVKLSKP